MSVLEGSLVVEFATGVAGPSAGMFLADYGARVVKVEPPDGDPFRGRAGFQALNRGKQSLVAADERSRGHLASLLKAADVVICAQPRAWRMFGIDDAVVESNQQLIVLHVPTFPEAAAGATESKELLSASLGMAFNQCSFTGGPIEVVEPHLLYVQGALGALGAVAALVERERTGWGQTVTVTGAHAFVAFAPQLLVFDPDAPVKTRDLGPGGAHPTYTCYEAGNGRWVFVGALTDKFIRRCLSVLDLDPLLDDPRISQQTDRLYSPDHRAWVRSELAKRFLAKTSEVWINEMEAADVPVAPVMTSAEWLAHPQFQASCDPVTVHHPQLGVVAMPGSPFTLTASPARISRHAPTLGSFDPAPAPAPVPARPTVPARQSRRESLPRRPSTSGEGPLAGLRVLSLGAYVAGPYAARLMYLLGADVIKVEPIEGDPWRRYGFQFSEGMRSLAIDLRAPAGRAVFTKLAASADAVIDNFRPGFLSRIGVDHTALVGAKPDIITTSLTGFGERGPLASSPGFDPVLGALSGMQATQGGDAEPVVMSLAVNDTCGAVLTALATTLALLHRQRTGVGQHVECSLAGAASYLQTDTLVRYTSRPGVRVGGRDFRGRTVWARYFQAQDGWIRLEARPSDKAILLERLGLTDLDFDADPIKTVAGAVAGREVATLMRAFESTAVRVVRARSARDAVADPAWQSSPLAHLVHPTGAKPYYTAGAVASFERHSSRVPAAVPGVGEHSMAVLAEIGVDGDEVRHLVDRGVVLRGHRYVPEVLEPYR